MHNTEYIGGKLFHYGQRPAVAGHSLPGYLVKWGQQQFRFFNEREEMENWFTQTREACLSAERRRAFKPLEIVYEGQRCGFFAEIECYTPTDMPPAEVDTLKAAIVRHVNDAYFSAGFDSTALLSSENHRGHKASFHVVGRDVDFEGIHPHSDLAHMTVKTHNPKAFKIHVQTSLKCEEANDTQEKVAQRLQAYFQQEQEDPTITVKYDGEYARDGGQPADSYRLDGMHRNCATCSGGPHESNGAGILDIGEGFFIYHCFSERGGSVHVYLPHAPPPALVYADEHDDGDENGRVPEFSDCIKRCVDVLGPMGSGKTHVSELFFQRHTGMPSVPNASILIICCRKSMCSSMTHRLEHPGFELYTSNMKARRLVIEYESLCKLQRTYDIIYMDEIRSVMRTAVCYATNRMNAVRHIERLVELCRKAKHTLLTDADSNLDCAVDIFRDSIFDKKDVRTIRVLKPFMQRTFTLMPKDATYRQMYADLRDGKRIVAFFASKKMLRGCVEHLESIIDKHLIAGYFADSENKDDLFDVNHFWGQYRFVSYTSTVTVSLDFTEEVYGVYALPNRFSSSPQQVLQAIGRSRNVLTKQIIVALDSSSRCMALERDYDHAADYNLELKILLDRRATITSFNQMSADERELYGTFRTKLTDDGPVHPPTLYTKVWADDRAEQTLKLRAWYPHFMWMVKKKGYKVEYADVDEREDGAPDVVREVATAGEVIAAEEVHEMDGIDATELDAEWEEVMNKKKSSEMLTRLEGACAQEHRKAVVYRILKEQATPAQLFAKHMTTVETARKFDIEIVVSQDYNIVMALNDLAVKVGFTEGGLEDRTTEVCLKEVNMTFGDVKRAIDKMRELGAGVSKSKTLPGLMSNWLINRFAPTGLLTTEYLGFLWRDIVEDPHRVVFGRLVKTMAAHDAMFPCGDRVVEGGAGEFMVPARLPGSVAESSLAKLQGAVSTGTRMQLAIDFYAEYVPPAIAQFLGAFGRSGDGYLRVLKLLVERYPGLQFNASMHPTYMSGPDAWQDSLDALQRDLLEKIDENLKDVLQRILGSFGAQSTVVDEALTKRLSSLRSDMQHDVSLQLDSHAQEAVVGVDERVRESLSKMKLGSDASSSTERRILTRVARNVAFLRWPIPRLLCVLPVPETDAEIPTIPAIGQVKELLEWAKKAKPLAKVGLALASIALKVCTGLAVPTAGFEAALGTKAGGALSGFVKKAHDSGIKKMASVAGERLGGGGPAGEPRIQNGRPSPLQGFAYDQLKEVGETFRARPPFPSFDTAMQLVDRGGRGEEWAWVRTRNIDQFVS
eukprot:g9006.t1